MQEIDIKSYLPEDIRELMSEWGYPSFHGEQIFKWIHSGTESFEDMSNLPKELRARLDKSCRIVDVTAERKLVSELDGTVKYLYRLEDGNFVESVFMKYDGWYSVCVSSQVGCRMGCKFCASGLNGLVRNLTPSEILSQITYAERDNGVRVSHVVMMGMGEPFDNFDNTVRFLRIASHKDGLNLSLRNISVSTCGRVDGINKLAEYKMPVTLSVSLHNADNAERSKIMPINNKYDVGTLLKACKEYIKRTGRRISFEYALIEGVNDSLTDALYLARSLRGLICHVNLIPANPVVENGFKRPNAKQVALFRSTLQKKGINTTVRRTLGADINASCGQLRRQEVEKTQALGGGV